MQNVKHNFKENLLSAIKAEDHERVIKLLLEEVGKVMANDKLALVRAIRKSGKDIPDDISAEALAKIISSGLINNNQQFISNLVETLFTIDQKYSSDGGIGGIVEGAGMAIQGISNAVAAGVTARGNILSAEEGTKQAGLNAKASQNNMIATMMNAKENSKSAMYGLETARLSAGSSSKTVLTIGLVLGGLMLIGFTGFLFYKKSQAGAGAPTA